MRSPSAKRAAIWSCSRVSRSASPWIAATAQILRALRKRANLPSAAPPFTTPRPARLGEGRVHLLAARQPAQPGALGLRERHAQGHPVLVEQHDNNTQAISGDLLRLDGGNLADAMSGIDHEIAVGERNLLGRHIFV